MLGQRQIDGAAGMVTVIDTSSPHNVIMTVIEAGANCVCAAPDSMAIVPDGSRLYVTNQRGNSVEPGQRHQHVHEHRSGHDCGRDSGQRAPSPDGALVYVASANWVSTISTATNTVIRTMQINVPSFGFPSAVVIGTPPPPAAPGQPHSVQTSISGSLLTVTWATGVGGAPTAHLLRFFQEGALLANVTTGPASPAQVSIPPGVSGTFTVTVTPYVGATAGPASPPVAFAIASATPGQPAGVQALVSDGILTVTWSLGPGVAPSAHVLNFHQGSTPVASLTTGAGSSAQIAIPPGVSGTFTVTVTPVAAGSPGPPSAPTSFTIGECVPPSAVTGLTGGIVAGTGTVSWNLSPGATAHIVQAGANHGGAELFNANIGNALSVSASGLPSGFTAWVRVFAANTCGTSAPQDVLVQ